MMQRQKQETSVSYFWDRTVIAKALQTLILGVPGQSQKATQAEWSKTLILHILGQTSSKLILQVLGRSKRILHIVGNVL
jgi:hypothetical protein